MPSQRVRKGQEVAAPKAFDASIPKETRIQTPSGVRVSARIRNKKDATDTSASPSSQQDSAVPVQARKPRANSKLSKSVSGSPTPSRDQQELTKSEGVTSQPLAKPVAAISPSKKPDKPALASNTSPKPKALGTIMIDLHRATSARQNSGKPRNMMGQAEDDEDFVEDTASTDSSFSDSDVSSEKDDLTDGDEPLMRGFPHIQGSQRTRRVRIALPEDETTLQPRRYATPGSEDDVRQTNLGFLKESRISNRNKGDQSERNPGSPTRYRVQRLLTDDPWSSSDFSYLANKRAFWWAHVWWIIVCFFAALLLWTLALSLYWGNHFATVGPPAPCDMTSSTRPFPQTYAESFKVFRRPDISWNPVVRQQMEDFGRHVGADPWLMNNCILPRNVMKLPLVTCQGRLPWYNLTEAQVMWLNENNDWAFNLDQELTEKFNKVFDMQFELQELQISWMLSDHGPGSVDYSSKRCQACKDLLTKDKPREKDSTQWRQSKNIEIFDEANLAKDRTPEKDSTPWSRIWKKFNKPKQTPKEDLPSFAAFEQLKKALIAEENEPIPLVEFVESDVPYWMGTGSVGPDLMYTETDGSSWRPTDGTYTVLRTAGER